MYEQEIEAFRREAAARFRRHHNAELADELMACVERAIARREWSVIRQMQREWREMERATTEQRVARARSATILRKLAQ